MWDIFISFVSGSAFLGGMASILVIFLAIKKKPEPSESDKQIFAYWKERNELYAEQIEVLRAIKIVLENRQ